jgi:mRNA interferase MazF
MTVMRAKVRRAFGRLSAEALLEVERRLAVFLGIAK